MIKAKKVLAVLIFSLLILQICTVMVSATTTYSISVSQVEGSAGDIVTVPIVINQNRGFVSLSLTVMYDDSVLTLESVHDTGLLKGSYHTAKYDSPYYLTWMDDTNTVNNTATGTIVELQFKIANHAKVGEYTIALSMNEDDALNANGENVDFAISNGCIMVKEPEHECTFGVWKKYSSRKHIRYCTECDEYETQSHNWDDGQIITEATHEDDGEILYTCEDCGATKTKYIDAEGHDYGSWVKYNAEMHRKTCSCGAFLEEQHNWNSGVVTKEPTATTTGIKTYTCESCKATKTEVIRIDPIPVSGIQLDKTSMKLTLGSSVRLNATIMPSNATNQNIIWQSYNADVASVSGGLVTANKAGTATITATTEDGSYSAQCIVTVDEEVIPVTGITLSQSSVTVKLGEGFRIEAIITPSNATNQKVVWKSSDITIAEVGTFAKPTFGLIAGRGVGTATVTATTEDGKCSAQCVVTVVEIPELFTFTRLFDGMYSVKLTDKTLAPENLVIPSTYNGAKVSMIASKGFKDCTKIVNVEIPEGITTLDTYAFYNCTNLKTITIPSTVSSIGDYSFYGTKPETIVYNGTKSQWEALIANVKGMPTGYLLKCLPENYFTFTKLSDGTYSVKLTDKTLAPENLVIPSTYNGAKVSTIASKGFKDCTKIVNVEIPEGITTLDTYAFYNCTNLKTIMIPSTVSSIGDYSFYGTRPETIVYNGTKSQWEALIANVKGMPPTGCYYLDCLPENYFTFTKLSDGTYSVKLTDKTLAPENLVIPSTYNGAKVSTIASKGFKDCTKIVNVEIPEGIMVIDSYAFYGCTSLKTIEVSETIGNIGDYAFYGCKALQQITYQGTAEWWSILSENVKGMPSNAIINCTRTTTPNAYFNFTALSNGTYSVTVKNKTEIPAHVGIPSVYNGVRLATIGRSAFKDSLVVESIAIPRGISSIDIYAFYGCKNLKTIYIPNTVKSIADYIFYNCTSLTVIYEGTMEEWQRLIAGKAGIPAGLKVVCTKKPTDNSYFSFTKLANGTYSVKLEDITNAPTHIVIPSVYNGARVTEIARSGFKDCTKLVSVEIPAGIQKISLYAFYGCTNLQSIKIPTTVKMMENYVFYNDKQLQTIVYDGTVSQWETLAGAVAGMPSNVQIRCAENIIIDTYFVYTMLADGSYSIKARDKNNLPTTLKIPVSGNGIKVSTIASKGFKDCAKIVSVEIPEGLTTLDTYAFYNCTNLKTITIPSTVSSIGNYSFYGCTTKIIYNGTKAQWASLISGVLGMPTGLEVECTKEPIPKPDPYFTFTKLSNGTYSVKLTDKTNAPAELEIPSTYNGAKVTMIESKGFKDCTKIVSVVIPEGITTIDIYGFYGCKNLKTITIPSTISSIGHYTFYGTGLGKVVYNGTKNQWDAIIGNVKGTPTGIEVECTQEPNPGPEDYFTFIKLSNGTYSVRLTDKTNAPAELVISSTYNGAKVSTIASKGFKDCTKIVSVEIPEGITTLDTYAFYNCMNLKTITIPSTVSSIGNYSFYGCTTKIIYNGTKAQWASLISGVLGIPAGLEVECCADAEPYLTFTKLADGTYSVKVTDKTNIPEKLVIPSAYNGAKVSTIASKGFKDCTKLVSVVIPEGITMLDTYAFYGCTNLKTMIIASTVNSIGNYSFYGCTAKVIYNGTKAQWASLISGVLGMPTTINCF